MNKCEMRRQFICGVNHDACNTGYHDYDCEYSGIGQDDLKPCEFRGFKVNGVCECECMGAIMECITEDQE